MEQLCDTIQMLDLMVQPGLCVKNGKIIKLNQAAQRLLLSPGGDIDSLLLTGKEEYAAYEGGCLYLTMNIAGQSLGASVTRMGELDVFLLDQENDQPELQAMALAARELREPLASVMISAEQLFPMTGAEANPHMRDQAARLNRGLMQLLRIVTNMSDASRCSAATATHQELRDVSAFMREIFGKAEVLASHAEVTLGYTGPDAPAFSLIDSQLVERAVLNILSNSLKFTPKGGEIKAKLSQRGNKLILTVQDNGQGIAQELRGNVFHRYLRQPALEDSRFGIGLGMVLIRSAAAQHGGTVLIDQPDETGTRITLTLTVRQNSAALVRSNMLHIDYAGERDHTLMELSNCLPAAAFDVKK